MNRSRVLRIILSLSLACALWFVNQKRPQPASHILARYPTGDAFDYAVKCHLEIRPSPYDPGQTAFLATWFVHQQPELQMSASASGQSAGGVGFDRLDFFYSKRSIYPRTIVKPGRSRIPTNTEFLSIRSLLKQLPPSSPPAQQGDLLLVTFNNVTSYETRVYDRTHTPQAVMDILKLTGAPLQELGSE